MRRITAEEWAAILSTMAGRRYERLRPVVEFAVETAMRRSEILGLLWSHIDLRRRTALLSDTKNGFARTVPLSRRAVEVLQHQQEQGLPTPFPVSVPALRAAWDKLVAEAGIADLHFHDLRHEAVSRLFERGLAVPEVALVSGHRDPRMLFRYTHMLAETIAKKLD